MGPKPRYSPRTPSSLQIVVAVPLMPLYVAVPNAAAAEPTPDPPPPLRPCRKPPCACNLVLITSSGQLTTPDTAPATPPEIVMIEDSGMRIRIRPAGFSRSWLEVRMPSDGLRFADASCAGENGLCVASGSIMLRKREIGEALVKAGQDCHDARCRMSAARCVEGGIRDEVGAGGPGCGELTPEREVPASPIYLGFTHTGESFRGVGRLTVVVVLYIDCTERCKRQMRFNEHRGIGIVGGGSKLWLGRSGRSVSPHINPTLVAGCQMIRKRLICHCRTNREFTFFHWL